MRKTKKRFNRKPSIIKCLYSILFVSFLISQNITLAQTSNNEKKSTYEESKEKILEKQVQLKEEMKKVEQELKSTLSEFVDLCKRRKNGNEEKE